MSLMKKSLTTFLFAGMSLLASAGSTNLGQELKQREVLFDGKSLVNWDYDKNFWGLQADGTLKGESTKENRTRSSTFIISKDHSYADFEIDNHKGKLLKGKIGLQLHKGKKMKVDFRNIRLKRLKK